MQQNPVFRRNVRRNLQFRTHVVKGDNGVSGGIELFDGDFLSHLDVGFDVIESRNLRMSYYLALV